MRKLLFITLILVFEHVQANDGSFYASGNTLIPLKETVIRLKKEVLDLTDYKNGFMQVNIYFEFFNPSEERELTVGFVTPPASGDVRDDEIAHPQVKDFFVMVNGLLLEYKVAKMNGSGFKLSDKLAQGDDFVYYFKVKFKRGITVIRHSYAFRGGTSVEHIWDYSYRLTTGTSWGGGIIEDFELNIRMGDDCIFGVPYQFVKQPANWEIIGIGKLGNTPHLNPYADSEEIRARQRAVFIKNGFIRLKEKNFRPQSDLSIVLTSLHNEINIWCDENTGNDFLKLNDLYIDDSTNAVVQSLSDKELKMFRNLNYARAGYEFKDLLIKKEFMKYIWYIPDPSISTEKVKETYISQSVLDFIRIEEKKRKIID